MKIPAAISQMASYLRQFDIDEGEARSLARLLLAAALAIPAASLILHVDQEVEEEFLADLAQPLKKLAAGYPIQYLLGETEFYGLSLACREGVLIPRGDSEVLVDYALSQLDPAAPLAIADICCGSGCLGLALLHHLPQAAVVSCDLAYAPLALTEENAERLGLRQRAEVRQGDLLTPLRAGERFDLIICNPPYISRPDLAKLPANVRHEPQLALDGGEDGLAFYRRLLPEAAAHLRPQGLLIVEHGDDQQQAVGEIAEQNGFAIRRQIMDLGRRPRGLAAEIK